MTWPTHVDLGAHRFQLIPDDAISDRGVDGETYRERLEIRLTTTGLAPTIEREVVLHELLHAAWNGTELRAEEHPAAEHQEQIVTALAPLVLELLRRNPHLADYLTG